VMEHTCYDIRVVDDLINLVKPNQLVVALVKGGHSVAYQADYESGTLHLLRCSQVFEYNYLTDLETVNLEDAGNLLIFSNNNVEPGAGYYDAIAPIYIAKKGHLSICGFADIQHTTDVTSWKRPGQEAIILSFVQQQGNSRRSLIHLFELHFKNGRCVVKPFKRQRTIGSAAYRGQRNTLCASEPFTIDQCLCGVQDIQILSSIRYQSAHLAVALANNIRNEHDMGCPVEELLSPENDNDKAFCCCPTANTFSFVVAYSRRSKSFDFLSAKPSAFQELYGQQRSVTEITALQTDKCCPVFQTVSPLGATELYMLEENMDGDLQVFSFVNHGLPAYVQRSSYGYCDDNDIIVSYTLHSFQPENTIYHILCNEERSTPIYGPQYVKSYRTALTNGGPSRSFNSSLPDKGPSYFHGLLNDVIPSYGTSRRLSAEYPDMQDYRNNTFRYGSGSYRPILPTGLNLTGSALTGSHAYQPAPYTLLPTGIQQYAPPYNQPSISVPYVPARYDDSPYQSGPG
jgi:hypothetical protein